MTKESLDGNSIFVIRDFATSPECEAFITQSEAAGYEEAPINTAVGFVMNKDIRDNSRVIRDDSELAGRLWQRAKPFLPVLIEEWRIVGLNERFRYYRYDAGQQFCAAWRRILPSREWRRKSTDVHGVPQ